MKTFSKTIEINTSRRFEFVSLNSGATRAVEESGVKEGIVFLFCFHTTAALVINEDDSTIHRDFEKVFNKLVPEDFSYEHTMEGKDNARAHQLAMILGNNIFVPIKNGKLDLGTWQSLFFVELLGSRRREVKFLIIGENTNIQ